MGQIYTRERSMTRGRFSQKKFESECLTEYAEVFPAVGGDFSFYQFPSREYWQRLFAVAPPHLKFGLKVPEEITVKEWPGHARYGGRAGKANEHYLDAELYERAAALGDRVAASFIVDGIHVDSAFLRVALRAKGIERSVLVTDAVAPAGCAPGPYRLGEVEVELREDGRVTLRGREQLAGSALRMDRGVENLMRLAGLSLPEALTMATRNPARVGRIEHRQRGLQPGERADLIEFDYEAPSRSIRIRRTWLSGELVFDSEPAR